MIKKVFNNKIFIFILGGLLFSSISVGAVSLIYSKDVTYDNSLSGLKATTVQGALDELYEKAEENKLSLQTVKLANKNVEICDDLSDLYLDSTEKDRYIYKGSNPKNYITFNNELWRIVSIESDGTIKIIKGTKLGYGEWANSSSGVDWENSTAFKYIKEKFYDNLSEDNRSKIIAHQFNVGSINSIYLTLEKTVEAENQQQWTGKLGLLSVSDYLKSNSSPTCNNLSSHQTNYNTNCNSSSYLWKILTRGTDDYAWFINQVNYGQAMFINGYSSTIKPIELTYTNPSYFPVVFLSSDIKLKGTGTETDPYTLSGQ